MKFSPRERSAANFARLPSFLLSLSLSLSSFLSFSSRTIWYVAAENRTRTFDRIYSSEYTATDIVQRRFVRTYVSHEFDCAVNKRKEKEEGGGGQVTRAGKKKKNHWRKGPLVVRPTHLRYLVSF